jgi:hypothetical protein
MDGTLDSAHQIGMSTISREVLTLDQGDCRRRIKNRELVNVFAFGLGTSIDPGKWMVSLDPAHRIGISIFFGDILTVVGAYHQWNQKKTGKSDPISVITSWQMVLSQNGWHYWIQRIE